MLSWFRMVALLSIAGASYSQTLTTLANFNGANGENPGYMSLVQGVDGNIWGTTPDGGPNSGGTVFKINAAGTLEVVHTFIGPEGSGPAGGLIVGANGNFYGTTEYGGVIYGVVYEITPSGTLTPILSFCPAFNCAEGGAPMGALVQTSNGNLYGTTSLGGSSTNCTMDAIQGCGTVFAVTLSGALTTLHNFDSADGFDSQAGLGTVFSITSGGTFQSLHSFAYSEGALPFAGLVQATNGYLYGTTAEGGANTGGTIFRVSESGELTTIYSFNLTDGSWPSALIQASDGNLYGTTQAGGIADVGTIFKITPAGDLTTLYSFPFDGGTTPQGGLLQATDGSFYGTTYQGGTNGLGTVFRFVAGLPAFVKTVPGSGKIGAVIRILGTNLTQATSVTFNGVPAAFTSRSASQITATVPAGATTGKIQVVTPAGRLSTIGVFRVDQ